MSSSRPRSPQAGVVGDRQIDVSNIEVISLHFDRLEGSDAPELVGKETPSDVTFHFQAARKKNQVRVTLTVEVAAKPIASIKASARTTLTVKTINGSSEVGQEELAEIAARMGPVAIYPYLREVVADTTRRAGLEPLTLPIYQIGTFFQAASEDLESTPDLDRKTPSKPGATQEPSSRKRSPKSTGKAKTKH